MVVVAVHLGMCHTDVYSLASGLPHCARIYFVVYEDNGLMSNRSMSSYNFLKNHFYIPYFFENDVDDDDHTNDDVITMKK